MPKFLHILTDKKGWKVTDGFDSGVGVDHWFKFQHHEAHINIDEENVTVSIDGNNNRYFKYQEACDFKGG